MKKIIAFLLIGFLVTSISHVTFAADTGPDKVPKIEKCALSVDLNCTVEVVAFEQMFVANDSYLYSPSKCIVKSETNKKWLDVDMYRPVRCSDNSYSYIKHKTFYLDKNYPIVLKHIDVWKDRIKQCILHSERSPITV